MMHDTFYAVHVSSLSKSNLKPKALIESSLTSLSCAFAPMH